MDRTSEPQTENHDGTTLAPDLRKGRKRITEQAPHVGSKLSQVKQQDDIKGLRCACFVSTSALYVITCMSLPPSGTSHITPQFRLKLLALSWAPSDRAVHSSRNCLTLETYNSESKSNVARPRGVCGFKHAGRPRCRCRPKFWIARKGTNACAVFGA
jgi:hypothetical protein